MSVARVTEITSESQSGFDAAVQDGIERANKTLKNITGAWIRDHEVIVRDGKIKKYRVKMKVTFVLEEE